MEATATHVLRRRVHVQQLDRTGPAADAAVLDLGVQDTGADGAAWALALRGVAPGAADTVTAWTLRGAPHVYRRSEVAAVAAATAPFSEADAAKRVFDAARPLKAAGIPVVDGLAEIAREMRDIATAPTVKGAMSGELGRRMPEPYLRFCRPCNTIHVHEQSFRLAALQAGLELRPGTSPPVLDRIPGWHGPADTVPVTVRGERRSLLEADAAGLSDPADVSGVVRLLGPFDPFLQARDRELLVPDEARRKELWRTLGRPGAVLVGHEVRGTWRPRGSGSKLRLLVAAWDALPDLTEQAERLAAFRGVRFAGFAS